MSLASGPHYFLEYGKSGKCGWILSHGGSSKPPVRCSKPPEDEIHIKVPKHHFDPYNATWYAPRCKECREFEDHPNHKRST